MKKIIFTRWDAWEKKKTENFRIKKISEKFIFYLEKMEILKFQFEIL